MIRTEEKAPAGAAAPEGAPCQAATAARASSRAPSAGQPPQGGDTAVKTKIETDPVAIIARAMLELDFQGRTVTAESLGEATELTEAEIETHWWAARDLARTRKRTAGREAA